MLEEPRVCKTALKLVPRPWHAGYGHLKAWRSVSPPWKSDSISKNETTGISNGLIIHSSIDEDSKIVGTHGGLVKELKIADM